MTRSAKIHTGKKNEPIPFAPEKVAQHLLAWYGREGRDLPWRHTRDPYRIWLSEIMLQQTTVAAVIPYYERFLKKFPTVSSLAAASLDDVISLWAGLGYYSRARNLYSAALIIVEERAGVFPNTLEGLMALPGVGKSTAGAILSIAFDVPAPILDGNVRRVLVRLFAWQGAPRSSKAEKKLWIWAERLTPDDSAHDYAQAIMDLGATVCTPRKPDCAGCPLKCLCQAYAIGLADELPAARKKAPLPIRKQVAIVASLNGSLLLRQRPTEGFLGGLWEFPTQDLVDFRNAESEALRMLADVGLRGPATFLADICHTYSHFKLELKVYAAAIDEVSLVAENNVMKWFSEEESGRLAIHGAHKKALAVLNLARGEKDL